MSAGPPDFEAIAIEDSQRIARLRLKPDDELRVAAAYDHWLKILFIEARKQRDPGGIHPRVVITSAPGHAVRRNVILDWGEGARLELFAQIWVELSGSQPKVLYRFAGHGYPAGDLGAL